MLRQRLIPSLLLRDGRLVKGVQFDNHKDAGLPHTTARAHTAQGADELILLDIDASRDCRNPDYQSIEKVAYECTIPLTVGGGIRTLEIAHQCMHAGADKLCLTTSAMDNPQLITELAHVYGRQAVVLGIDVIEEKGKLSLYDHRTKSLYQKQEFKNWAREGVSYGAGEIRIMSVDREGKRCGMNINLLGQLRDNISVPIVFEGGAGNLEHLDEAFSAGIDAIGVGTMLVFSDNNIIKIKRFLEGRKRNIRL